MLDNEARNWMQETGNALRSNENTIIVSSRSVYVVRVYLLSVQERRNIL